MADQEIALCHRCGNRYDISDAKDHTCSASSIPAKGQEKVPTVTTEAVVKV